ncbi:ferredoxin-2, mitochondrial [Nematocida major]|uniref:ferredoxin-2, mitochondrial n=1 Tax=Nematocida major TaxID=1912982 RepID=UPI0020073D4A|nr:ferredoxin-2, mitochondrial [Nematocida major]KAH9387001.1 ferredoxin-2, mitochondrial [Nematocida major]
MGLVQLLFKFKDSLFPLTVSEGVTLLEAAASSDSVPLRGACEGSLACTTCHVILEKGVYDKCKEMSEREEDLLDSTKLLTATSRLGCQVKVTKDMDNRTIKIPAINRNIEVPRPQASPHNLE